METWKSITGWPTYEVSDMGRVRRVSGGRWKKPGTVLKNGDRGKGYLRVMLRDNGRSKTFFVHHLVAEAFHGPRPSGHDAAHLNGQRGDNSASNIAWVTHRENQRHKQLHGTVARGERQGSSKLTSEQVAYIRAQPKKYGTLKTLAAELGVHAHTLSVIRRRKSWRHEA